MIIIEVKSFEPKSRGTHTATLIDNKLYILGGSINDLDEEAGKEFFSLDVSVPFSTQNIPWVDLTSINLIPSHKRASAVKGGANNKTLILYGGEPIKKRMEALYTYDTQNNFWSVSENVRYSIKKSGLFPIIDNKGKMYLFGGFISGDNAGNGLYVGNGYVNDMSILDTINFKWEQGSSINAPSRRGYYGAVLLPDQKIIYIGK